MNGLRVYVSASSAELSRAQRFIRAVEDTPDCVITHDWTVAVKREREKRADHDIPRDEQREYAEDDLAGAMTCDVFVALSPFPGISSRGQLVELGAAHAAGCPVMLASGDPSALGLFGSLLEPRENDDAILRWLRGKAS